jgi:hypothetical protein
MMQTEISAKTALGVPGEHGNTQPYRADSYIAKAAITMGSLVALDGDGIIPATGATALGIAVSTHEHVRMVLPTDATSLVVHAGSSVAVASKGTWFVAKPVDAVKGSKLKIASGVLTVDPAGAFAEVLEVDDSVALIRLY